MYQRLLIADRGVSLFQSRCGTNMVRSSARAAFVTLGDAQLRSRNFLDCDGGIWAAEGQPSGARQLHYLIREREFLREPAGRSEERRVGKEGVRSGRCRWWVDN